MDRIATTNKAVDLFGVGKHGFKQGNLGAGVAPTELSAAWFNSVQEELIAVIEAGGLVPNTAVLNQLLLALRADNVLRTPASNSADLVAGFARLPGGLIVQSGTGTTNASAVLAVTFPLAFPTAVRSVLAMAQQSGNVLISTTNASVSVTGATFNSFTANTGAINPSYLFRWTAIGY